MKAAFPSAAWTPLRLDGELVRWCHTEGVAFEEPFFSETIERCLRHPFRLLFQPTTSLCELVAYAAETAPVPIGGMIFHQSRCGSTLVAQMLAALPGHRVLSEPPALDAAARTRDHEVIAAMVNALAQGTPRPARAFFKPDAWSTRNIAAITAALPGVPWVFLYRDPFEILDSHARRFGGHTVPGALPPEWFGFTDADVRELTAIEYAARSLARIAEAALEVRDDPRGRFVNYRDLPAFVVDELPTLWDFDADVDAMRAVATRDAKNPAIAFDPARPPLRAADEVAVRAAAERWLVPVYEKLETAR